MSHPIAHAWLHDPSLRWAGAAFVLWLSATLLQWRRLPVLWSMSRIIWVMLAGVLLCLGIIGELQALIYLASAFLLVVPIVGPWRKRIGFMLSACVWMPGLAWLLFPLFGASLDWLTLLVASVLLIYSLKEARLSYASKTSHTSL
jgi:hypothetical protein